ncbi:2-succinylbenzoate--CoA ligase [Kribbella antibiotica]|uniref:2-succinylbenzoate--CoA ligase n=1 Tax=Kribbella antibiotica TaxID=190195 RepID=UPI001404847B|nr:2-succinylbenzoate--CoA ligase [Kribbella antibiotica]
MDDGRQLGTYVVLRGSATSEELTGALQTPCEIAIVDEFPRNATGKVLRNKLGG